MTEEQIKEQLEGTLEHINQLLRNLEVIAERHGCALHELQDKMGRFMAQDLLIAKANALSVLARMTK